MGSVLTGWPVAVRAVAIAGVAGSVAESVMTPTANGPTWRTVAGAAGWRRAVRRVGRTLATVLAFPTELGRASPPPRFTAMIVTAAVAPTSAASAVTRLRQISAVGGRRRPAGGCAPVLAREAGTWGPSDEAVIDEQRCPDRSDSRR